LLPAALPKAISFQDITAPIWFGLIRQRSLPSEKPEDLQYMPHTDAGFPLDACALRGMHFGSLGITAFTYRTSKSFKAT